MKKKAVIIGLLLLSFACTPLLAREILYFKNRRTIEARDYYINDGLIFITLTTGAQVYLRENQVDWDTTKRITEGNVIFHKLPYEELGMPEEGGKAEYITQLSDMSRMRKKYRRSGHRTINISVDSAKAWTDTGIDLQLGQTVMISTHGTIKLWGSVDAPPSGLLSEQAVEGAQKIMADRSFGCLLGKVGSLGKPFYCGSRMNLKSPVNGRLFLGPNDRDPDDNTGFWDVSVAMERERKYAPGFSTTGYTLESRSTPAPAAEEAAPSGGLRRDFKRARSGY